jgi:hypothetical protein
MKNLQSLLSDKGINVIANEQLFMVRGGSKKGGKKSVKSRGSHKSFGSKGTRKGGSVIVVAPPVVFNP